jgi:hypothetical protein
MDIFKDCPNCRRRWPDRDAFLEDGELELAGYQVNFRELELGLILFNHAACRTTLAVHAKHFLDLYHGPVFDERRTGLEDCPQLCLRKDELSACDAPCECACIRAILQVIRAWPKSGSLRRPLSLRRR